MTEAAISPCAVGTGLVSQLTTQPQALGAEAAWACWELLRGEHRGAWEAPRGPCVSQTVSPLKLKSAVCLRQPPGPHTGSAASTARALRWVSSPSEEPSTANGVLFRCWPRRRPRRRPRHRPQHGPQRGPRRGPQHRPQHRPRHRPAANVPRAALTSSQGPGQD